VDLLEALLLAACFAVIKIPVSSFQIPHFEVTIESLIHVLIRNDPRKENRIFICCFILKTFRFSFRKGLPKYFLASQILLGPLLALSLSHMSDSTGF